MSHRSEIARKPTKMTTKTPTNFTATDPASIAPVADSQNHQGKVKALFNSKQKFNLIQYLKWQHLYLTDRVDYGI